MAGGRHLRRRREGQSHLPSHQRGGLPASPPPAASQSASMRLVRSLSSVASDHGAPAVHWEATAAARSLAPRALSLSLNSGRASQLIGFTGVPGWVGSGSDPLRGVTARTARQGFERPHPCPLLSQDAGTDNHLLSMDVPMNAATTPCTPRPQPDHDVFSPLSPPPPTFVTASGGAPPLLLQWTTANTSNGSLNLLPFRSPDSVSYSPTTATPKKPRPPRRKPDAASASTSTSAATPPCTECGKCFSSWKALFGHMRCHPERQWRGINPPPHFRRPSPPGAAQFSDEEYQVAASLIMLANGPPRDGSSVDVVFDSKAVFGWLQRRARQKNPRSEGEEGVVGCEVGRKRAWVDSEALGTAHKCNVCYKGFSSGQALGGHKRCHLERGEGQTGSSSSAKDCALDLNLPPPMESSESSPRPALDLRLGI